MKPLLTAKEVSEVLRLSERTIFSLTKSGKLPVIRMGSSVRYAPEDVQAYIDGQRLQSAGISDSLVVAQ